MGVTFSFLQSSCISPSHRDQSKMIDSGLTMTSARTFSSCGCIPSSPHSPAQASWHFYLTFCSLEWTFLEHGGDPWILISFLRPLFPLGLYPTGLSKLIFEEAKDCFPEVQGCKLAFHPASSPQEPKHHHLLVTAAKAVFNLHNPNESSLFGD